ncbi:hypothetical protein [Teichococcus oryzae]|uniref:Uncharacterized protein n=1 Tax=Teichococcus oryzae TaxID=1608942 RepID=A0A5B2T9L5_9PROT|nr:hypothetical protein [Pseudoroseomonas oryzae]KAA2211316.1 hypothetical protein F0Q34_20720 [Pseudoroseomonas oryzae]
MNQAEFLARIQRPAAQWALVHAGIQSSIEAHRFLLAVAGQESACTHRAQVPIDYAHGFWQFEKGGGVHGVMTHRTSAAKARALCEAASVRFEATAIWRAIEGHDGLAYGFARLLLLTDPYPIPVEQHAAWACYALRLWRPGKPHPQTWPVWWQGAGLTSSRA